MLAWGGLQRGGQFISVEPVSGYTLVEFVLWHRQFVAKQTDLFLTWDSLAIKTDTTPAEISAFTGLVD